VNEALDFYSEAQSEFKNNQNAPPKKYHPGKNWISW
jgi:hypothetical protein